MRNSGQGMGDSGKSTLSSLGRVCCLLVVLLVGIGMLRSSYRYEGVGDAVARDALRATCQHGDAVLSR